ncbi:MAG TPA: hypothetical protein VLU38_03550 [Methanomassiliicoccales archaeon]|nr:hypothetical protein [Methanomassiliicoccales archaeon]
MLSGKEELSGGYRLAGVRRTKRYLYLVELAILVVAVILVIVMDSRASLVPFYLPINSFIFFVLLMGLIIVVENFFFRALEMRFIKSASTKFYICKMGIRSAIIAIAICVVIILLLWLPFIHNAIEDATATDGTLVNNGSTSATVYYSFSDRDALGLTSVSTIKVTATGGEARVYLVSEQYFNAHKGDVSSLASYRINTYDYVANPSLTIHVENLPHGVYYLVLDTKSSAATSVSYTITSSISSTFLSYVPLFAALYAVAYAGWLIYLTPLKRKYSEAAIYR